MIQSIPVNPVPPNTPTYDFVSLQIVKTYTRATALAAGFDVPDPDPTKPLKPWKDDSPSAQGDGLIVYNIAVNGTIQPLFLSKADARSFNLPGAHVYPVYTPAPTPATLGGVYPVDQTRLPLSSEADAQSIAALFGTSYTDTTPVNGMYPFIANGETRRVFQIQFKGQYFFVGQLLAEAGASGVGAPGTWDLTGDTPKWVSTQSVVTGPGQVGVPVRALLPTETVLPPGIMGTYQITNTPVAAPPSTDGFTAADRVVLMAIQSAVVK